MKERTRSSVVVSMVIVAGLLTGVVALIAFAGPWWWVFGLLQHFRVVYALVLVAAVATAMIAGRRVVATLLLMLLVVDIVPVIAAFEGGDEGGGGPEIRVLLSNLFFANPERRPFQELVAEENPDVIIAVEVTDRWQNDLGLLLRDYPYHMAEPRVDCSGLGVWSRFPLDDVQTVVLGTEMRRSLQMTIFVPGAAPIVVVATHPPPPVGPEASHARDTHLDDLAVHLATIQSPVLIAGDLNATPWSTSLVRLVRATGLRFAGRRLGPGGSWPSAIPLLRIPIDHVLLDPWIKVIRYRVGPDIGSDHRPIVVDLELPPAV